ncbi:MAG: cell division protein ZapA [Thermodesulfobacteriota bacterium]|nr:cell division protein ZapA [Thermodesulfobacteriota bacterium]
MDTVKVKILDHEYQIKSEEDMEQVHRIAEYVNEKLREVKENAAGLSEKKTAILAALHIASEYFQLLKERDEILANVQRRTRAMIYNIDSMTG